jgi:hypothetical protein
MLEKAVVDQVIKHSLPRLQKLKIYVCVHTTLDPVLRHFSPADIYLFRVNFSIFYPSTPVPLKNPLPFRLSDENLTTLMNNIHLAFVLHNLTVSFTFIRHFSYDKFTINWSYVLRNIVL